MLSLGLTGGIAAGKSLLSARFRELGALVIDADQLARDVVAPGTPGLAAIAEHFGTNVLLSDGSLNRPALGALVFADKAQLAALNAITHPLVRSAAAALKSDAGPSTIVVQDIPLLVETGQGSAFHLVVVAEAPQEIRLHRMLHDRGMNREDALARIAAQATDEQRAAAADVVIVNDATPDVALAALDTLWHERLLPFAANLNLGRAAQAIKGRGSVEFTGGGSAVVARALARLQHTLGEKATVLTGAQEFESTFRVLPTPEVAASEVVKLLGEAGYFLSPQSGGAAMLASADPGQHLSIELAGAAA